MLNTISGLLGGIGPAPTDYESIQTFTLGSSQASVTFSSIPSTYTHLQIRAIIRSTTSSGTGLMRFNSDTGSNYSRHYMYGDGSGVYAGAQTSQTGMDVVYVSESTQLANTFSVNVIDILDYANTNKNKTVRNLCGAEYNSTGYLVLNSGSWMNTSAVSTITLIPGTNFAQYSSFALYGIK
jgi:hypothetical protein